QFDLVVAVLCVRHLGRAAQRAETKDSHERNHQHVDLGLSAARPELGPAVCSDFSGSAAGLQLRSFSRPELRRAERFSDLHVLQHDHPIDHRVRRHHAGEAAGALRGGRRGDHRPVLSRDSGGAPGGHADEPDRARIVTRWWPIALLLVSVLVAPLARAQPGSADTAAGTMDAATQPPPQPESTDTSQSPVPDLGKGAEGVAALLRHLTESLSDSAAFSALEAEVAADAHRAAALWVETAPLLKANLRPSALDSLASSRDALRSELGDRSDRVDQRASRREADLETLTKLHASWTRAFDLARKADDPASVLERAQSTLEAIDAARPPIEARRAKVLVLQDSVSRSLETCDDALARIDDARREAVERTFARPL